MANENGTTRVLLACGIVGAALYPLADIVASLRCCSSSPSASGE